MAGIYTHAIVKVAQMHDSMYTCHESAYKVSINNLGWGKYSLQVHPRQWTCGAVPLG